MKLVTLWGKNTVHVLRENQPYTLCGLPKVFRDWSLAPSSSGRGFEVLNVWPGPSNEKPRQKLVPAPKGSRPTCGFCRKRYWEKSRIAQA